MGNACACRLAAQEYGGGEFAEDVSRGVKCRVDHGGWLAFSVVSDPFALSN